MKIAFENTFTDILRFHASHQFRSTPLQIINTLAPIYILYSEYSYGGLFGNPNPTLFQAFITALICYVAIWAFQFTFNVFYLYSTKNKSVLTKHIVELKSDYLYEETKYNKSYFYWHGVVKVIRITGFIAVYVSPHMALIIPNRAFANDLHREHFYNTAMEHLRKSA